MRSKGWTISITPHKRTALSTNERMALSLFMCVQIEFAAAHTSVRHRSHKCIHDEPTTRRAIYGSHLTNNSNRFEILTLGSVKPNVAGDTGPEETLTVAGIRPSDNAGSADQGRLFGAKTAALQSMRMVFRTPNLYDNTTFCTSASGMVPDFTGSNITCSDSMVFTEAKRDLLINTVLPRAGQILSRYLSLIPDFNLIEVPAGICGDYNTIPSADTNVGVANADFIVYVSAAPITEGTIAWAGMCAIYPPTGRPIVARSNFAPEYLSDDDIENVINIAVHELTHALGFSYAFINSTYFGLSNVISANQTRRGGQPVYLYKGPSALAAARTHFNCPTLDGVELEDEGGSGTAHSHWERRTHRDDLMAGITGPVMALSEMTFGLLEDSGHYTLNRSVVATDTSGSHDPYGLIVPAPNLPFETAKYMHDFGCGVFYNQCNTTEGGAGTYFCFDQTSTVRYCSREYSSIGFCNAGLYDSTLPAWGQYFNNNTSFGGAEQLYDYCPYVSGYSNRQCNDYQNTFANDTIQGLYFGSDGRCFETSPELVKEEYHYGTSNPGGARCFQSRCPNGTRVEFRIGDSDWVECPVDGKMDVVAAPPGYTGNVTCPLASDFCTSDLYYDPPNTTETSNAITSPSVTSTSTTTPTSTSTAIATTGAQSTSLATTAALSSTTLSTSALPPTTIAIETSTALYSSSTTTAPSSASPTPSSTEPIAPTSSPPPTTSTVTASSTKITTTEMETTTMVTPTSQSATISTSQTTATWHTTSTASPAHSTTSTGVPTTAASSTSPIPTPTNNSDGNNSGRHSDSGSAGQEEGALASLESTPIVVGIVVAVVFIAVIVGAVFLKMRKTSKEQSYGDYNHNYGDTTTGGGGGSAEESSQARIKVIIDQSPYHSTSTSYEPPTKSEPLGDEMAPMLQHQEEHVAVAIPVKERSSSI